MNLKIYPVYLSKTVGLQNNAIDKFREHLNNLQCRLNDFAYFHSNENTEYSDLNEKCQQLYIITDKILDSLFESFIPDETCPIIFKNESIEYIKKVYKEMEDKKTLYYEIQKATKELCLSRDPNEFKEILSSSEVCLKRLGIELNNDELKIFNKNQKKLLEHNLEIERVDIDSDSDLDLSDEKENLFGQVLSEYCLYNTIKLFKQSKANFKESCKKIDTAYKTEIENSFMLLQNQIASLISENRNLKQINEKNASKLRDNEVQIEELQELLDIKSTQNKKFSNEIMELKGNTTAPEIIYNADDSSDDIDASEVLKFLSETEPDDSSNQNYEQAKERTIIPISFEPEESENDRKPNLLTIPMKKPIAKKPIPLKKTNPEIPNDDSTNKNISDNETSLLNQLKEKDDIINNLQKNIADLMAQYRKVLLL